MTWHATRKRERPRAACVAKPTCSPAPCTPLARTPHAGEEAGPDYIRDALDSLQAERIDHGIHVLDDPALLASMAAAGTPITLCPLSNVQLQARRGVVADGQPVAWACLADTHGTLRMMA